MNLTSGTRLGPYEVLDLLGAGGMGEVYRARDKRLDRDVALKVLLHPGTSTPIDDEVLHRFEKEARAAGALNHPNILSVHDVGTHEGTPYIVSELLQGETLRERLKGGPLPTRKAVDFAAQISRALAAAHDKGIVHRDLKPENLFITKEGRLKVLDFGIAKLAGDVDEVTGAAAASSASGTASHTQPGAILGTVGYMSPEQVRGQPVDHRSDIFSLGAILFEMLAGARPFEGESRVDTAYSILNDDPPPLADSGRSFPPALERIVLRCLEKRAPERFQSALDLAFNLESFSGTGELSPFAQETRRIGRKSNLGRNMGIAAGLLLVGLAIAATGTRVFEPSNARALADRQRGLFAPTQPTYQKVTFRRGPIHSARFAPDGQTVVYSATWDEDGSDIYIAHPGQAESRALDIQNAQLLSISAKGDLAFLQRANREGLPCGMHCEDPEDSGTWTLFRAAISGGAPRAVMQRVLAGDFAPDGESFAVVRFPENKKDGQWLELAGKKLFETGGYLDAVRFSPRGDRIAFLHHPVEGDDKGLVTVVDLEGRVTTLTRVWASLQGLAWSPDGRELWFTAAETGLTRVLRAVNMAGETHVLEAAPGPLTLHDVSPSGRVLLTLDQNERGIVAKAPDDDKERELSWFDWSVLGDLSWDGESVLIMESGDGAGSEYALYLRKTDGSPAMLLGKGSTPAALSPDGKWAIAVGGSDRQSLTLLPTGPGESRALDFGRPVIYESLSWFPDSKHVLVLAHERMKDQRIYIMSVDGGEPKLAAPPGWRIFGTKLIAPDGQWFVAMNHNVDATDPKRHFYLYPVEHGEPRVLDIDVRKEYPVAWSEDGQRLYIVDNADDKMTFTSLDMKTGKRAPVRQIRPIDNSGLLKVQGKLLSPDGRGHAYTYVRVSSTLYIVSGVS